MFEHSEDLDPIELAALDMRTVRVAQYLVNAIKTGHDEDESDFIAQIGSEYMLRPDEVRAALDIAEDRIYRS